MANQENQQRRGRGIAQVPVGPRFQAVVAEWKEPDNRDLAYADDSNLDTSGRWLGTRIWPVEFDTKEDCGETGKRRSDFCNCSVIGSLDCMRQHTSEERERLHSELGPAFGSWNFDEMGVGVSRSWTQDQERKFDIIVRRNPPSKDRSFVQPAMASLSKTRAEVVSYYLNVYLPRKFSTGEILHTDDEAIGKRKSAKGSSQSSQPSQSHYLLGRR
ncbi:hypothetical protein Dimus_020210 [Dionaea muscipula]